MENPLKYFTKLKDPRVERRRCTVLEDLSLLDSSAEWTPLQGLVRIEAERYRKASGKIEREILYCITSLKPDEARLNQTIHGKRLQKAWDHDYLLIILGVHVSMRLP